jgi:hypothetical protein
MCCCSQPNIFNLAAKEALEGLQWDTITYNVATQAASQLLLTIQWPGWELHHPT